MSENLNNNQLDFYQNQINPNQNNQASIHLRRDIRQVSFEVDENFLQSSFNKFLQENFNKIQGFDQNNQSIAQLYNVFQIMAQEIIKLKSDLIQAFDTERNKISEIDENKNQQINKMCEIWGVENSKNIENIKSVNNALNENNHKIKELANQSKKLEDSILNNKLENDKIKNDFKILNSNLKVAQNKNDGYEKTINNISELCNNNNIKIIELENKLINLENNYKNNEEINKINTNLNDIKIQFDKNSNNISNFEKQLKKNKKEIDNQIKEMKEKIEDMNNTNYEKLDDITKEINKVKNDIINKKIEGLKIKNNTTYNDILDNLKTQINEFIEKNNKEVNEIKQNKQ